MNKIMHRPVAIFSKPWMVPVFKRGWKKQLGEEDLFATLNEHASETLGNELEKIWKKQLLKEKPSLWIAICKGFVPRLLVLSVLFLAGEALKIVQTLALGEIIEYFTIDSNAKSIKDAYLYASVIAATCLINVLITHNYFLNLQHIGMKMRVACCTMIYRKSLKLSQTALAQTTVAHMVNLMSNDVNRFDDFILHLDTIWLSPLILGVVFYVIFTYVGPSGCAGFSVYLLYVPLQIFITKRISSYRSKTAKRTDERVGLMNQIVNGIKVIKMYTWEKAFAKLVETTRKLEMKEIKGASYLRGLIIAFLHFGTRLAIFTSVLTLILLGQPPTAYYVFIVSSFFNSLRVIVTAHLPEGLMQLAELNISIKRIQAFLLLEEKDESDDATIPTTSENVRVSITNGCAKWIPTSPINTLNNINLQIHKNETLGITGRVGGGKSTLLHVILKELPLIAGKISVNGSVSYASQDPWIFSGTIRQNILLGLPLDDSKYAKVITACALQRDFLLLPRGDATVIGERGVTLSGGQKARINLARAVYRDADIYLLDDPLSAVDAHVGKQIFQNCVKGYLKNKTVVLVTHQVQFLGDVDRVVVLNDGGVSEQGRFDELKLEKLEFEESGGVEEDYKESEFMVESKDVEEVKEHRSYDKISSKVYQSYIAAGGGCCVAFLVILLFALSQILASGADYFITWWVNLEETATTPSETNTFFTTQNNTYIYSGLILATVFSAFLTSLVFFNFCVRASTKLHNKMFSKIVYATMWFFNTNPSGRILNRFTKDTGAVDEVLPLNMADTFQLGMSVLGIIVLTALMDYWLIVAVVVLAVFALFLRKIYLATSRNVKRLEGITKSPVFTHINASLQGITTIRAFGVQGLLNREFDAHQDMHSSAYFTFMGCTRTFAFWIDGLSAFYVVIVTYSFLVFFNESYAGNIGLSITQALSLTGMVQWGLRQWSELENQMTSVERIVEYTQVHPEATEDGVQPPKSWPQHGKIEFRHVSLKYSAEDVYVLKDLNFIVGANEKVGIVGRTGAGKSSLITALFRLATTEGTILIDEVPTNQISLQGLRSKISIIPQEPVLFSGTLRRNLDPFDEHNDEALWAALEEVDLKPVVLALPGALAHHVTEDGGNFSVGQRQLLCLARAIVRKNKILVLDEATANVDNRTDEIIRETIKRRFFGYTVLTIAHRLHSVVDGDKVLVMDEGKVVEYDHPHVLLEKKGVFYGLVQQTGPAVAAALAETARMSWKRHF